MNADAEELKEPEYDALEMRNTGIKYAKLVPFTRDGFSFVESSWQGSAYQIRSAIVRCKDTGNRKYIEITVSNPDGLNPVNPTCWSAEDLPVRIIHLRDTSLDAKSKSLDWLVRCVKYGIDDDNGIEVGIRFGTGGKWTNVIKVCPTTFNGTVTSVTMLAEGDVRMGVDCDEVKRRTRRSIVNITPIYGEYDIDRYNGNVSKDRLHEAYERCRELMCEALVNEEGMTREEAFREVHGRVLNIVFSQDDDTKEWSFTVEGCVKTVSVKA